MSLCTLGRWRGPLSDGTKSSGPDLASNQFAHISERVKPAQKCSPKPSGPSHAPNHAGDSQHTQKEINSLRALALVHPTHPYLPPRWWLPGHLISPCSLQNQLMHQSHTYCIRKIPHNITPSRKGNRQKKKNKMGKQRNMNQKKNIKEKSIL